MSRPHHAARSAARPLVLAGAAVAAAAASLALAGCGGSPAASGSGGSGQAAGGSGQAAGGTSPSATPSGSAAAGSGNGVATSAYFPVATGNTWVYRETVGGGTGTTTDKMTAVRPTAAGERVTMTHTTSYPVPATTKETLLFLSDGSVEVPLTQFGGTSVTIESGGVIWPSAAALGSGQSRTSTIVMKVKQGGLTRTITLPVTVRGEGQASVKVPGGTYRATVIGETVTMSAHGFKVTVSVRTWVADGVGPVKSEAFTSAGSSAAPVSTEELVSFSRG